MRNLTPAEEQWIFSEDALQNTSSRADGISLEDELKRRRDAIWHMVSLAHRTQLAVPDIDPHTTKAKGVMTTGMTLLHRFYMRRSFKDFAEMLIAPTMLFLASKIEEEPVKLRYLVNHCLGKWDPSALTWDPEGVDKQKQHQSRQYQQWERDILATEEIVLETLCFDMGVNQPWIILQRGVRGLDTFLAGLDDKTNGEFEAESSEQAAARHSKIDRTNGHDKLDEEVTLSEQLIIDLGWSILNNAYVSPLPVLHPSAVIAFVVFVLVVACLEEIPFSQARAAAAEFGPSFGLDIDFDETSGAAGSDADEVDECTRQLIQYCKDNIIDDGGSLAMLVIDPETNSPNKPYRRRFTRAPVTGPQESVPAKIGHVETNGTMTGEATPNGTVSTIGKNTPVDGTASPNGRGITSSGRAETPSDDLFGDEEYRASAPTPPM